MITGARPKKGFTMSLKVSAMLWVAISICGMGVSVSSLQYFIAIERQAL